VYDVTGAGDTVIAITAAAMAAGAALEPAVRLANRGAGIVVGRLGTAAVSAAELAAAGVMHDEPAATGVVSEAELMAAIQQARASGSRIVMTNGCFDILHAGHVHYLEQAKALGDRLVVAVNNDDSVSRLKGNGRPINSLANRIAVLSGLRSVDWVVPFSEDTPERLIAAVLPEVLVKGADYTPDQIAGAPQVIAAGGEVRTVPLVEGLSSSAIISTCGSSIPVPGKDY
jgi:D-beta-D-heptose 7-phosphate kinase/D-beta-D-heptose 1-phosphate adenosyltransferase